MCWLLMDGEYNIDYHFQTNLFSIHPCKGLSYNFWCLSFVFLSEFQYDFSILCRMRVFFSGTRAHNPAASRGHISVSLLTASLWSVAISLHISEAFCFGQRPTSFGSTRFDVKSFFLRLLILEVRQYLSLFPLKAQKIESGKIRRQKTFLLKTRIFCYTLKEYILTIRMLQKIVSCTFCIL